MILLVLFFTLYSSFKSYSRKSHKLFIGCDYYIEKRLCIFYNDKSCYCMNLKREIGYYTEHEDFIMKINTRNRNLTEWEKIQKHHLRPKESTLIIYTNRSYINEYVEKKYQPMVEFEMIHNIDQNWCDIKDIVLYEQRYEENSLK